VRFTKGVERDRRRNGRARQDVVSDCKTERVSHSASAKQNQGGRAGKARCCEHCGEPLRPKRGGRPPKFCDAACRKAAFRSKQWENSAGSYEGPQAGRNGENRPLVSNGYKADFVGQTPSIVGPLIVIEREIISGRTWESVVSPDGVTCQLARYRTRERVR
jgi:hypothetical protein